jgi:anaerobic ribonucleoside-triphosphate reductase
MESMEMKETNVKSDVLLEKLNQSVNIQVIKKDGTKEAYNIEKIKRAVEKAAERVSVDVPEEAMREICVDVYCSIISKHKDEVTVSEMHNLVEKALDEYDKNVAESYRNYRNYKQDFVHMLDHVYKEAQRIMYIGDVSNANADSTLVSTKRSLVHNTISEDLYKKFFLTTEELQASNEGYIYIHDKNGRQYSTNCCLVDMKNILKGGFELGNVKYTEPKTLPVVFGVISDITMSMASQQYGGYSICEVDKLLAPYAEKTYNKYLEKYLELGVPYEKAEEQATYDIKRDFEQGFQQWEIKWNTLNSSRGDYIFVTTSFGLGKGKFEKMANEAILKTRMNGQGEEGHKKPVLFPKLIFLYDEALHGEGCELEETFNQAIACSQKAMYPDYISLSGPNYVGQMYQKYGKPITAMGCADGQEVVTYKIGNELYVEAFERMWNRLSEKLQPMGQVSEDDKNKYIDLRAEDVQIYDTKKGFTKVRGLVRNVQSNWCTVTLSNGRVVKVTTDHPFETENKGVVLAGDLQLKDRIIINPSQFSEETVNPNLNEAWLDGVMLCDGCYQKSSVFGSFAKEGEDELIEKFISSFEEVYGVRAERKLQERGSKGTYYDVIVRAGGAIPISELIGIFEKKFEGIQKTKRHIPNEVFKYSREGKLAFFAGMIDADGYINKLKSKNYCIVQIGSTNKELALQQAALAQSLGMFSKVYANHYNSKDPSKIRYRVEFYPTGDLVKYITCPKKKGKFVPNKNHTAFFGIVTKIELESQEGFSYDVTTESEHFEFSGVYSHNCRSFLSPWYERGGMYPADENDTPIFEGRGNIGVVSLNLPMIFMKAKQENKDFYEVLDYYLELIRNLHKRTMAYLGEMKASTNPLGYMEGGFLGGHLKADDKIKPVLKAFTTSFGITALNELQRLYNGKSITEDGEFALEVMKYIADKVEQFKKEDGILHSCYGTPAESLCKTQVEQFRMKYGIIEHVSDREYMTNSFHCHVSEDITPVEKQDLEERFIDLCKGGQIFFTRFNCDYNGEAFKTVVRRGMKKGFYEGTNLNLSYCEDCGEEGIDMKECPKCGSHNITTISRVCGYLGYEKVKGQTRYNSGKYAETQDRVSY